MQVVGHFFENGITSFTMRINSAISFGAANGEVAPFVGHNAYVHVGRALLTFQVSTVEGDPGCGVHRPGRRLAQAVVRNTRIRGFRPSLATADERMVIEMGVLLRWRVPGRCLPHLRRRGISTVS